MNINGSSIGAVIGTIDKEALKKRQANKERIARKKEEGQKKAVKVMTDAMKNGTSMVDARMQANELLAASGKEIVGECLSQVREHIDDAVEKNQKKAEELKEKKQKKEERKKRKEEREAIRKGQLVLKRVLVPVVREVEQDEAITTDVCLEGVQKYVMSTEPVPTAVKVGNLLDKQA